jgi:acetyl-CoA carboxylase biotin carboxylase subunit
MGETAIKVIKTANYNNIGTVEFLVDKDNSFYFLEVNARIQVEHPITEMTTGIDLVKLQIHLAQGGEMPYKQEELTQSGHAIECRIYAEDADNNFMPSSGKILMLREPKGPGVRYDSGIYEGAEVSVYYDPVLAKLIVWGNNREEARKKMIIALKENVILGVKTSIAFMIKCLEHPEYIAGNTFTNFIDQNMSDIKEDKAHLLNIALLSAGMTEQSNSKNSGSIQTVSNVQLSPWQTIGKWEICSGKY